MAVGKALYPGSHLQEEPVPLIGQETGMASEVVTEK